jgi:2-polyprenyl-3-methyl-5-hydroxy-6-metoxy-1,4-benzoquinol methylase
MKPENKLVELQHTLYTSSNPTRRSLHCSRRDWIFAAIKRYSGEKYDSNALEVGPGSGIYLPVLAALFDNVTAIDIEEAYLINARKLMPAHPNLSLKVDDILNSVLPDGYFDFILCTEVVEHISGSEVAIAEMRRLLRPGGILLLSTPQRYSPLEITAKVAFLPGVIQLVRMIYQEPIIETGHINLMTERQVVDQLEASGFKMVEQYKSGFYIPLVAEFMGHLGLRVENWIEARIRSSALDGVLWTQYYIAQA